MIPIRITRSREGGEGEPVRSSWLHVTSSVAGVPEFQNRSGGYPPSLFLDFHLSTSPRPASPGFPQAVAPANPPSFMFPSAALFFQIFAQAGKIAANAGLGRSKT
jgi:hypothetical protein